MRIYLDDERPCPDGWTPARWPEDVISLLEGGQVRELSLDHDLGDDVRGTGYDVVLWIEEAVATRGFVPPIIRVHSANASARQKMEAGIRSIERLATALPIEERASETREVGTGTAADLLGVSRPHVVKLIDSGVLPGRKEGTHRRVRLADLLAYKRRAEQLHQGLDELARESEDLGLSDFPSRGGDGDP